jgi:SAM-dependent methyltransferase
MNDWIDFYDSSHSIYVSPRHAEIHFRTIAEDIIGFIPRTDAVVVDYSCGEAFSAPRIAAACGKLVLAEPAPGVRARIEQRTSSIPNIDVCSLDELEGNYARTADLVVMNSVAQYMTSEELDAALGRIRSLLKPEGMFVLGDIIRPGTGPVTDASALLRFAARHGFLKDAFVGLIRTALSDYRRIRQRIGLSTYTEADILRRLRAAGFDGRHHARNIGHNPARMTFCARPAVKS